MLTSYLFTKIALNVRKLKNKSRFVIKAAFNKIVKNIFISYLRIHLLYQVS